MSGDSWRGRTAPARRSHRRSVLLRFALMALVLGACRPAPHNFGEPERRSAVVRVGILVRLNEVVARTRGAWRGHSSDGEWSIGDGTTLTATAADHRAVMTLENGVRYSDPAEIRIEPVTDESQLVVAGTPYRGAFRFRFDDDHMTLIDTLPIEEYLRGVVGWEIGWLASSLQAAVEAQAIAARTYTCTRLGQFEAQGFDVYADERDQVFRGAIREDAVVDRAITATRGLVLKSGGDLIQAYYSSTCGGYTSWIEHVWPKPAAPYLRGQRDADPDGRSFCADSPHFRWSETWDGATFDRTLQETLPRVLQLVPGTVVGSVLDVRAVNRDESGRVLDLDVQTTAGLYHVHGDPIRWLLRPPGRPLLRSLMFELEIEQRDGKIARVVARGGGNGHGVGMCQTGAMAMARRGFARDAILSHYYPGTTVTMEY